MLCVCTACLFGVSAPPQLLLLRFSKGGGMMGAGGFLRPAFCL